MKTASAVPEEGALYGDFRVRSKMPLESKLGAA